MIDSEDSRYRIMELRDGQPREVAATSREGIGLCLVTLAEDRREAGIKQVPVLGVLDGVEHHWVTSLWEAKHA